MPRRTAALLACAVLVLAACGSRSPVFTPSPDIAATLTEPDRSAADPGSRAAPDTQAKLPDSRDPADPPASPPASEADGKPDRRTREQRTPPPVVRGIYLSGWYAGSPDLSEPLLAWARDAGVNTVVIDLKSENGELSWISEIPLAAEIGANVAKVADFPAYIRHLHDLGFWVVGRVVCFTDPLLFAGVPSARLPGFDGGAYSFVRPDDQTVQDYLLAIARAGIAAGIDEIQFDYVRYPESLTATAGTTVESRTAAIEGFLRRAVSELKPLGVLISADVFGLTTSVEPGDDMEIGQRYEEIVKIVDFISPMMYPSHYAEGTYGIPDPDKEPYATVRESMARALARTPGIPVEKHRPWIQDFTYPAPGYKPYTREDVEGQIRALREQGVMSFLLWDPSNRYTRDTNLFVGE